MSKNKFMSKILKKCDFKNILWLLVLISLTASIIYILFRIAMAPDAFSAENGDLLRSDYILMLIQCILGVVVIFLPNAIEKKWSMRIPNQMCILYYIFLYAAIYLGEVRKFYYIIPHWDSILHAMSAIMLGVFGFWLIDLLNGSEAVSVKLSPLFVSLFAFCFALSIGALWEIYEFSGDALFGLNMQKYRLADGTQLLGHAALTDTMKDIIIDAIGAFLVAAFGYAGRIFKNIISCKKSDKQEKVKK